MSHKPAVYVQFHGYTDEQQLTMNNSILQHTKRGELVYTRHPKAPEACTCVVCPQNVLPISIARPQVNKFAKETSCLSCF